MTRLSAIMRIPCKSMWGPCLIIWGFIPGFCEHRKSNGKVQTRLSLLLWFAGLTALMIAITHYA